MAVKMAPGTPIIALDGPVEAEDTGGVSAPAAAVAPAPMRAGDVAISRGQKEAHTTDLPPAGARFVAGDGHWVEVYARAHLPTKTGHFDILVFKNSIDDKEHVALVRGALSNVKNVMTRLHSECLTGDVFGSLRCDCRDQLELAKAQLAAEAFGVLIYLRQEGRGIGLGNKVKAYTLQEQGLDTVDANRHLGFDDDGRDYRVAAMILGLLNIESVRLVTNNPRKFDALCQLGIQVVGRIPIIAAPNAHNAHYLETKRRRAGHLLPG